MKKVMTIFLISVLTFGCVSKHKWTKTDTFLQAGGLVLLSIDYYQTRDIADDPDHYECNTILGRNPDKTKVTTYFLSTAIIHTVVAYLLPGFYRKVWQIGLIGIEGVVIIDNYEKR